MRYTESNSIFQDMTLRCSDCGESFRWTSGEQSYFYDRGLSQPKRCPSCRKLRRMTIHPPMPVDEAIERANALFPNDGNHQGVSP